MIAQTVNIHYNKFNTTLSEFVSTKMKDKVIRITRLYKAIDRLVLYIS